MPRPRHILPVPALLALILGSGPAWAATSTAERDAHWEAVSILIEREYRLPAGRQMADFHAARYPESSWHDSYLAWSYARTFRFLSPDPAERTRLTAEARRLGHELERTARLGRLPEAIATRMDGQERLFRLVNALLRQVGGDQAAGAKLGDGRRALLQQAIAELAAMTRSSFSSAVTGIERQQADEDRLWDYAERDPRYLATARQAVERRLAALRPVYFAVHTLQEVAERGRAFGLDPRPAEEFLASFVPANHARFQEWDYAWGDFHPYLRAMSVDLAAQAALYRTKALRIEDLAADLRRVIDLDVDRVFPDRAVADEVRTLQARAWGDLIAWYRRLGGQRDPRWWQEGRAAYREFCERADGLDCFRLDQPDRERAVEVARIHLQAARLLLAMRAPGAVGIFGRIARQRSNPLSVHAMAWMQQVQETIDARGGAERWGAQPFAMDPGAAVLEGQAAVQRALGLTDRAHQRSRLLAAAATFRDGVLGLRSRRSGSTDQVMPELWFRYADCLVRLGMGHHAAIVAQEGLRQVQQRQQMPGAAAPWRTSDGTWTASGRYIGMLARTAIATASRLRQAAPGQSTGALLDATISLVQAVSPADGGRSLDRSQIAIAIDAGEWTHADALVRSFAEAHPEAWADAATARLQIHSGRYDDTEDEDERRRLAEAALAEADAITRDAQARLATSGEADDRAAITATLHAAESLRAFFALRRGEFERVFTLLGPDYWRQPPTDPVRASRMLGYLCEAARGWYEQRQSATGVDRQDPRRLQAAWTRLASIYGIWQAQHRRLGDAAATSLRRSGSQLAWVFHAIMAKRIPSLPVAVQRQDGMQDIRSQASRAFADLMEPQLTTGSRSGLILMVAGALWDAHERQRAARLYSICLKQFADDASLQRLRAEPRARLAALDEILQTRPDMRKDWDLIVDLLSDHGGLSRQIMQHGLAADDWGERLRDYPEAVGRIKAMRTKISDNRFVFGQAYAAVDADLAALEEQATRLAWEITALERVAAVRMADGQRTEAASLYQRLLDYAPTDPEYMGATVELALAEVKDGGLQSRQELETVRVTASRLRDAAPSHSFAYWRSVVQVLELSAAMGDRDLVASRLRFDAVSRSTPDDDLQSYPRNPGDDPAAKRLADAESAALCRRYLALFEQRGVDIAPTFRIQEFVIDGTPVPVSIPASSPPFSVRPGRTADGTPSACIVRSEEGRP